MSVVLDLHLYDLHPLQERIRAEARRFNVVALGRRAGKTTLGHDLVIETVLDDRAPCAWFAPNYKNLGETWRELVDLLRPVAKRISEADHRIEVLGGGVIECWSLDSEAVADSVRGRKYKRVVIDEAGTVRGLLEVWQKVIRPTLTDLIGDAWFFSTPRGLNAFYTLYQRGQDPNHPTWASWQAPTTANPHIDPDEVEEARRDLPERVFNQEFGAEFLESGAGVFRRVSEAAVLEPKGPVEGHWYVAGIDWGREHDYTVISVLDVTAREQVAMDRYSQTEYALQMARLTAVHDRYRPAAILAEANAMGGPLVEALQRKGWPIRPWTATNATKAAVIDQLALVLDRGDIRILNDDVQTAELHAYTSERLPSGLIRYTAPEGMHDDTVIALALACEAASTAGPTQEPQSYSVALGEKRAAQLTQDEKLRRFLGPRQGVNPFAKVTNGA